MAFTTIFSLSLLAASYASAQSTTLQPVFELPLDATSTVFRSTITTTSSLDCAGSSLVVKTFRATISTPVPTPTTTTTEAVTTSASFVCLPETSAPSRSTSTLSPPVSPTGSPLPPVSPAAQALIDELSTALLYAELFSNAGDQAKLCSLINPASLDEIEGVAINGSAVQQEVCALASIELADPSLGATVIAENQGAVQYLEAALFAVQVAGNYAGGPNLAKLCSEIQVSLLNGIFVGFVPDGGTAVRDFVCGAAAASASASPTAKATAACGTTAPPYPRNTTAATTTTPTCASPTGFANTVVPAPRALATSNFEIAPAFTAAHTVFEVRNLDVSLSEASIATDCLDRCVAYRHNATTGPCLSFNVNIGRPIPPTGNGGPLQWFCSGFDAALSDDASDYVPVGAKESYMHGLGVNRVCNGTYRAY